MRPIQTTMLIILAVMYSCHGPNIPVQKADAIRPDSGKKLHSGTTAKEPIAKKSSGKENKQAFIPEKQLIAQTLKDSLPGHHMQEQTAFAKSTETPSQEFTFPYDRDTVIRLAQGTMLRIAARSLVYECDKKPVTGLINLVAREFYSDQDILQAGLSTRTAKEILETGGMVYLEATANNQKCNIAAGKSIGISFASSGNNKGMQLYNGYPGADGAITWELAGSTPKKEVFTVVEEQPQFPGGEKAMEQFFRENLRYPAEAASLGIRGKVYVTFVVEEDGSVSETRVLRGIGGGCDEEAMRVATMMPPWNPGKQRGNPVRVQFNLPVQFTLDDGAGESQATGNPGNPGISNSAGYSVDLEAETLKAGFLPSVKLGWLNYDRLYAISGPRIDFIIQTPPEAQLHLAIVFQRVRVFLTPSFTRNGLALFRQVPKNALVTLVASKQEKGKMLISKQEITLSEKAMVKFNFTPAP